MKTEKSKIELTLDISEEILLNIENGDIPFEQVLLKCKRLARLRDDYYALNWFSVEIHGYSEENKIQGIDREDMEQYAAKSGRLIFEKDPKTNEEITKYWTTSISEIESYIETNVISLENLKPPSQFTPAVNKHSGYLFGTPSSSETVIEKYQDVLNSMQGSKKTMSETITTYKSLLSKIKNNVYNYVLQINLQLRFENITESIFQETKVVVDKKLSEVCPDAIKKFVAAYNRLKSDNPEEWSQAMSSCRNILKEYADYVFPPQKDNYKKRNGESLIVTDDKYKNRILAFIDKSCSGDKNKILSSRISDLEVRIHALNDILSKGTHEGINLVDVNICVLETYFFIGSLLDYTSK
jgi:hypothetical protein